MCMRLILRWFLVLFGASGHCHEDVSQSLFMLHTVNKHDIRRSTFSFILLMTLLFRSRPKTEPYEMSQTCRCAPALRRGWAGGSGLSFGGCVGEAADRRSTDTHTPLESPERLRASAPSAAAHPSQRLHSAAAARNKTFTFMILYMHMKQIFLWKSTQHCGFCLWRWSAH